jgi:hypothetical protein
MAIGGVAIAAGVLGLLTSAHYNRALGRAGAFSDDTVLTWFVIGFRSIVPPFVFTLLFLVIGRVIAAVWHFAQRLIPPARRVGDLTRTTISGTLERLTGSDAATAAQGLLLVQVLAVALIGWFYRDLIATLPVLVNEAEPGALNVLDPQPSNGLLYSYGAVTSVLLASMWIGWHRLIARSGPLLPRGTVVAGVQGSNLLRHRQPGRGSTPVLSDLAETPAHANRQIQRRRRAQQPRRDLRAARRREQTAVDRAPPIPKGVRHATSDRDRTDGADDDRAVGQTCVGAVGVVQVDSGAERPRAIRRQRADYLVQLHTPR